MLAKLILLVALGCVLVTVADAADKVVTSKVMIDPRLCQALVKHTPDANVAYQPGVDVYGNKVAPADLPNDSAIKLPDVIKVPLTVSLAKVLNFDTTQYPFNQLVEGAAVDLGMLTVQGDHVLFNGKPITDEQQDNLAVLCMKPNK